MDGVKLTTSASWFTGKQRQYDTSVGFANMDRLWGNPGHLEYMSSALRDKHSEDSLHILVATTNSNNNTYDGIEVGAERVTHETEKYIEDLESKGTKIRKLSVVGYSLGGLVARYAIGLLYARGWFDRLAPVNFTTFASPHLGVRAPVMGLQHRIWNILGSRTLSTSGRQLFTIDTFRDTKRPLLSLLADPSSIFMIALSRFPNRVLYANCINDRSAPYYTTSISTTDPFTNLDTINMNYLKDYEPIILDPTHPITVKPPRKRPSFFTRLVGSSGTLLSQAPLFGLLVVLVPIGSFVFLVNSGIQSVRSQKRIRLHEEGKAGIGLGSYRIPLMAENARSAIEGAIENISSGPKLLPATYSKDQPPKRDSVPSQNGQLEKSDKQVNQIDGFATLPLSSEQFEMVDALDKLGFKKYRVYIHDVRHSHAAIIVRMKRRAFEPGKTVVRHWLDEEFEI